METIVTYLEKEKNMPTVLVNRTVKKFERNTDIADELKLWIKTGEYKTESMVVVDGYSAGDIKRLAPFLDGIGVFNFMITLRENPEKGREIIKAGFPRK